MSGCCPETQISLSGLWSIRVLNSFPRPWVVGEGWLCSRSSSQNISRRYMSSVFSLLNFVFNSRQWTTCSFLISVSTVKHADYYLITKYTIYTIIVKLPTYIALSLFEALCKHSFIFTPPQWRRWARIIHSILQLRKLRPKESHSMPVAKLGLEFRNSPLAPLCAHSLHWPSYLPYI